MSLPVSGAPPESVRLPQQPGRQKTDHPEKVAAIVLAAGQSRRMGQVDKIRAILNRAPLVAWSIDTFERCSDIDEIIIVSNTENISYLRGLVTGSHPKGLSSQRPWTKVKEVCLGGERRRDSVKEGLTRTTDSEWVIIHDAARPFVTTDMVKEGLREAKRWGAATAAIPVSDTLKQVAADNKVIQTLSRDGVWAIQTPQVFRYDILWEAHNSVSQDVTDDASLVELSHKDVAVYQGSPLNIKITGPSDLVLAEAIARIYEDRDRI